MDSLYGFNVPLGILSQKQALVGLGIVLLISIIGLIRQRKEKLSLN